MTLLLLAGTGEAREIAQALAARGVAALASLAGATRQPHALALPTRVGGFGGAARFAAFLEEEGIRAVLDATHPFAHRISARTAEICAAQGLPYGQLLRPAWVAGPGDLWTDLAEEPDAAAVIPPEAIVFLATGRKSLAGFSNLAPRRIYCRQIDPPEAPFPWPGGSYLVGRPPFSVADETKLFGNLGVTWLIVKNAGGAASATKLVAARDLGIQVAMIARPSQPPGPKLASVAEALAWVAALDIADQNPFPKP
jgi:precorrin-6A/cobalt-precorrin-6A reductase